MYKIIIVEDDNNFALQLKQSLERFNYDISIIEDFENVSEYILINNPHLVIMDVTLPNHDGFYWTQQVRIKSKVPIIFLSSRDERLEQVMAMSMGADDYLTKPVDFELFMMKVQVMLRRTYDYEMVETSSILEYNELFLDLNKFSLSYLDNAIELTKNEFKIIQKLFENKEEYVTRDELMTYLWNNDSFIDDNAFNVNLSRLRKKLLDLTNKDLIITKRGVGYKLEK